MLMPLVMLVALGVATGLRFGLPAVRRWRMGALLRGDWWCAVRARIQVVRGRGRSRSASERQRRVQRCRCRGLACARRPRGRAALSGPTWSSGVSSVALAVSTPSMPTPPAIHGRRAKGGRDPGGRDPGGRDPGGRDPGGRDPYTQQPPAPSTSVSLRFRHTFAPARRAMSHQMGAMTPTSSHVAVAGRRFVTKWALLGAPSSSTRADESRRAYEAVWT